MLHIHLDNNRKLGVDVAHWSGWWMDYYTAVVASSHYAMYLSATSQCVNQLKTTEP